MIRVTLSPEEERRALRVAKARNEEAVGWDPSFDPKTTEWAHQVGALAELAFCKMMQIEWPARLSQHLTHLPDVDPFWEIRWSSNARHAKVRQAPAEGRRYTDDPGLFVAHVTGQSPTFDIHGYIRAAWAQEHVMAKDIPDREGKPRNRPAHFVRLDSLVPIGPGFHDICSWASIDGRWLCVYCGKTDV